MKNPPTILITTGDPEGIGPEVTDKALKDSQVKSLANFIIIKPSDKTGFDAIEKAVAILKKGKADGLVTAPVNKSRISASCHKFLQETLGTMPSDPYYQESKSRGISKEGALFKGHTEYLAKVTHTKKFAMMFCGSGLKITIVTRHIALKDVPRALKREKIEDAISLTYTALKKYFKLQHPRIGVCGLNPHCGEAGLMGKEEKEVIIPAIEKIKQELSGIQGPLPSDVLFYRAYKREFDAVIAMYHDQGLGPFKMVAFENGVNITLGLPFVRTSPDHGTAYDIAGKGIADPTSMKEAIKLAVRMCSER